MHAVRRTDAFASYIQLHCNYLCEPSRSNLSKKSELRNDACNVNTAIAEPFHELIIY